MGGRDGENAAKRPPTDAERASRGKAARSDVPRRAHGDWSPPPARADPVAVLEEQDETRLPELVPIRYGRMLVSPFAFFRGAAAIMAADLADGPRTGLQAQLCGDAHLSNFGIFAAPDRRLTFNVNDFDETLPGPFEWDLKRLAASFAVAGRERGLGRKARERVSTAVTRSYREAIRDFASMRTLDLWYARVEVDELARSFTEQASSKDARRLERNLAKARTKDSLKAFAKLTHVVDGKRRIVSDPPLIVPVDELPAAGGQEIPHATVERVIEDYRRTLSSDCRQLMERFHYVDAARKVVGVGSVGTRAWIVLMLGRDGDDPLFLQAKEAGASVLEPYVGKSAYSNHGQRVVEGQRLVQSASDILLGWIREQDADGVPHDFYVRQLWDAKGSASVETMTEPNLAEYGRLCGWTLAKAHARSGDPIAIAAYLGTGDVFDRALSGFAEAYADQNERDYAALEDAAKEGRVRAESGV
ncbi:MAG TPA: DUF2252 domain-containing protein [Gaiellaceae bacterium]|nr:DUF2252 domain-containing protein [Gaiellaceae bacterium]